MMENEIKIEQEYQNWILNQIKIDPDYARVRKLDFFVKMMEWI